MVVLTNLLLLLYLYCFLVVVVVVVVLLYTRTLVVVVQCSTKQHTTTCSTTASNKNEAQGNETVAFGQEDTAYPHSYLHIQKKIQTKVPNPNFDRGYGAVRGWSTGTL